MRRTVVVTLSILAAAGIAAPAAAQDAVACGNEALRLSSGFPGSGTGLGAGQPGTRVDAGMSAEQQGRARDLIQQARSAAQRGDGARCMQSLTEARAMLRQGGVGAPVSSGAAVPGTTDNPRNRAGEPGATDTTGARRPADAPGTRTPAANATPGTRGTLDGTAPPQGAEAPRIAPPPARQSRPTATGADGGGGTPGTATSPGATGTTGGTTGGTTSRGTSGGGARSPGGSAGGGGGR